MAAPEGTLAADVEAVARQVMAENPPVPTTKVAWGFSSTIGLLATIAGAAGTIVAAAKANDVATAVAGVSTITTAVTTLGGRYAQAVQLAKRVVHVAQPYVDALDEAK